MYLRNRIIFLAAMVLLVAVNAHGWKVENKRELPEETVYSIRCDNGSKAEVKLMHPKRREKRYESGWWLVVGGSNFNYHSMADAVKVACKYPK